MKIQMPLEVWADVFAPIRRRRLANRLNEIGSRSFAEIAMFYLHEYGKIKLKWMSFGGPCGYHKMTETEMPANIKDFESIQICAKEDDEIDCSLMTTFFTHLRPLLSNVNLWCNFNYYQLDYSIYENHVPDFLSKLLPLIDSINSIHFFDDHCFDLVHDQFRNKFFATKIISIIYDMDPWEHYYAQQTYDRIVWKPKMAKLRKWLFFNGNDADDDNIDNTEGNDANVVDQPRILYVNDIPLELCHEEIDHISRQIDKLKTEFSIKTLEKNAMDGLRHIINGFRLFFYEHGLCVKYLWKMRKEALTRKERQQILRNMADQFRLLPFMVFTIKPFMLVFIPFYIKFFPNLVPSTFQDRSKDIREQGDSPTNADLLKYINVFEEEFTIDYLGVQMLRALCQIFDVSATLGSPEILCSWLNMKLRELKADDKMIIAEGGVNVLSVQELQAACNERGMRSFGLSVERLRKQLKQWLKLSMNYEVPPSLLLFSRAMYFPEEQNFTKTFKTIIALLPKQQIGQHTALKLKEIEIEGMTDPKARIELLKSIELALKRKRRN